MTEMAKGSVTHQRLIALLSQEVLTSASLPMKR
ncbi:YbaK/prolyl-tRNA synthetase-associated domain protein [Escherichia coli]|nr:YbaK/prolyl-tRNA synthetase-associated domain protein [Escherichia coli]